MNFIQLACAQTNQVSIIDLNVIARLEPRCHLLKTPNEKIYINDLNVMCYIISYFDTGNAKATAGAAFMESPLVFSALEFTCKELNLTRLLRSISTMEARNKRKFVYDANRVGNHVFFMSSFGIKVPPADYYKQFPMSFRGDFFDAMGFAIMDAYNHLSGFEYIRNVCRLYFNGTAHKTISGFTDRFEQYIEMYRRTPSAAPLGRLVDASREFGEIDNPYHLAGLYIPDKDTKTMFMEAFSYATMSYDVVAEVIAAGKVYGELPGMMMVSEELRDELRIKMSDIPKLTQYSGDVDDLFSSGDAGQPKMKKRKI
jgi:hypothetical protein